MSRILSVANLTRLFFSLMKSWRHTVAAVLIVTLIVSVVIPLPAYAQFGVLGSIQNILSIINTAIQTVLNAMKVVSSAIEALHQQVVWPVRLINQAKNTI